MSAEPDPPLVRESAAGPKSLGRRRKWLLVAAITLVALVGLYVGASAYTNRPAFCNTCHEMTPYYSAWQTGAHANVSCVECHVDPGVVAGLAHKFVALKEVWLHFTGDPAFPLATDIDLPNARCTRCHSGTIDPKIANFDHEEHRRGRTCKTCHDAVGHAVSAGALQDAGILNADVQAQRDARKGIVAGQGVALAGHKQVGCSNCHDMPASPCAACHESPAGHFQRPCTTCHTPAAWSFAHPDASASCVLCHDRPANHRAGQCSECHAPGVSWDFVHPASADCGSCHSRPAGHRAGQCSACHAPGKTWAFVHPSSAACADCHTPPANHYGPNCANCHSPGRPFASATFSHPAVPGGEHTYRSFECAKCHPSGPPAVNCTCHGGNPPSEGD